MTQQDLLQRLEVELRASLEDIRTHVAGLSPEQLQHRTDPDSWTILETLAHLNQYADDYLPALHRAVHRAKARRWTPDQQVAYTARGTRLINRANPDNGKTLKSAKRYNFSNQPIDPAVVKSFIIKCEQLLRLLQAAREVDLNRPKVPKANAWTGKYTLGNMLEFLVLHQRRHLLQVVRKLDVPAVVEN